MSSRVDAALAAARRQRPADLADLGAWLRIPSVSGSARHAADVTAAAAWVRRRLTQCGAETETINTGHGPVVLARVPGSGAGSGRASAAGSERPVIIYGHLDVKPAGAGWCTPAFTPTLLRGPRGPRLFARGASDDKGQLMVHLVALAAWARVGGPPVDVLVIIDGAEEVGSPGLRDLLSAPRLPRLLRGLAGSGPVLLCSDTQMRSPGRPTLTESLRGMINIRLEVRTDRPPVHAGRFGGQVADPGLELARRLTQFRRQVDLLPGPRQPVRRACVSVTSLRAGGPPGAVPSAAYADLDVRLPPWVDAERAAGLITQVLRGSSTPGTEVRARPGSRSPGDQLVLPRTVRNAVVRAIRGGFGTKCVAVDSGGTIPGVTALSRTFDSKTILLGLGHPNDGAHGPNEFCDLLDWTRGVATSILLLAELQAASVIPEGDSRSSGQR